METMLIVKFISLVLSFWFGIILLVEAARGVGSGVFKLVTFSVSIVTFIWSMGWLN